MSSSNSTAQYEMPYKLPASTEVLQTTSYVGHRHISTAQPRMTEIRVQWTEQLFTLHIPTSFWDPQTYTYQPASFADLSAALAEQLGIPTTRNRCGDRALPALDACVPAVLAGAKVAAQIGVLGREGGARKFGEDGDLAPQAHGGGHVVAQGLVRAVERVAVEHGIVGGVR